MRPLFIFPWSCFFLLKKVLFISEWINFLVQRTTLCKTNSLLSLHCSIGVETGEWVFFAKWTYWGNRRLGQKLFCKMWCFYLPLFWWLEMWYFLDQFWWENLEIWKLRSPQRQKGRQYADLSKHLLYSLIFFIKIFDLF